MASKRGNRGRRERVDLARRQAALALGRDPDRLDPRTDPSALTSATTSSAALAAGDASTPPVVATAAADGAVGVLTIGEAAVRLQLPRSELEALIARGAVKALPTEFTVMIPTSEVDRLRRSGP